MALLSACLACLSLVACNRNGSSQNGAYVSAATNASLPVSGQGLPPSSEYQAVAETAPPPLPVYDQPPIPGSGYVWTPGYWDWSDDAGDYYWVPGTWVEPPGTGQLWTPGYWRYYNGRYLFSGGYWGPQVGFYGGVDYGFGYNGSGYAGGRWQGNQFYYNSQANNLGARRIGETYSEPLPARASQVSFNGGPGGLRVAPAQADIAAAHLAHAPPTSGQRDQARMASAEPQLRAGVNRGAPPIAATARPTAFRAGADVTAAHSAGVYAPPPGRQGPSGGAAQPAPARAAFGHPSATSVREPSQIAANPNRMVAAPIEPLAAHAQAPRMSAPGPIRGALHTQEMRAPPLQAAPQQHAPQIHAAPPGPAAHPAPPKPSDSPDRRG